MTDLQIIFDFTMCIMWLWAYVFVLVGCIKYRYPMISPLGQAIIFFIWIIRCFKNHCFWRILFALYNSHLFFVGIGGGCNTFCYYQDRVYQKKKHCTIYHVCFVPNNNNVLFCCDTKSDVFLFILQHYSWWTYLVVVCF